MTDIEYSSRLMKTARPSGYVYDPAFLEALEGGIDAAKRQQDKGALLFISIENLPPVISVYGDSAGEEIMEQLIHEAKALLGLQSLVARARKDLIAVLLPRTTEEETVNITETLHHLIQHFGSQHASIPVHLCEAMGSVDFPVSASTAQEALEKAYIALHIAQQGECGYHVAYTAIGKRQTQARHQMVMASYLQHAMLENRLRLAFQPIINSKNGHIIYHESLLRIVGEDGRINSAGPFIPIAESMGFIDEIDHHVLEMVAKELEAYKDIVLAFNISNMTVQNEKWLKRAQTLFADPDIGSRVVIEMTETAVHSNLRLVSYFTAAVQDLGCQVAIDDFGVGYTSFRQLKALPIDIVKIDGYFVKDIMDNPDNRLFVETLLNFTRGLGLKAVAEFVETGEIAKMLMELRVDYMQGNYFCPAVNYRSWAKGDNFT